MIRGNFSPLENLAGCYNVIVDSSRGVCIAADPAGIYSPYYNNSEIASSPSLLANLTRNRTVDNAYVLRDSDNWYTGSTTPFEGVRWLLSNHVLRVEDWSITRHWPAAGPVSERPSEEVISDIALRIQTGLCNLCENRVAVISITGGRDSRVNVAAAVCAGVQASTFTILTPTLSKREKRIVEQIVRASGVRHRFVPLSDDPEVVRAYDEMTAGLSLGGRREVAASCMSIGGNNTVHVNGNLGALFLGFFWPNSDPRHLDVRVLAKEFVQRPPLILRGLEEWVASVPEMPARDIYNLMYLEQRGGRWMGVGERAGQMFYDSYSPFNSRAVFHLLRSLPIEWQCRGRALGELVRRLNPCLSAIPFVSGTTLAARWIPKSLKVRFKTLMGCKTE